MTAIVSTPRDGSSCKSTTIRTYVWSLHWERATSKTRRVCLTCMHAGSKPPSRAKYFCPSLAACRASSQLKQPKAGTRYERVTAVRYRGTCQVMQRTVATQVVPQVVRSHFVGTSIHEGRYVMVPPYVRTTRKRWLGKVTGAGYRPWRSSPWVSKRDDPVSWFFPFNSFGTTDT